MVDGREIREREAECVHRAAVVPAERGERRALALCLQHVVVCIDVVLDGVRVASVANHTGSCSKRSGHAIVRTARDLRCRIPAGDRRPIEPELVPVRDRRQQDDAARRQLRLERRQRVADARLKVPLAREGAGRGDREGVARARDVGAAHIGAAALDRDVVEVVRQRVDRVRRACVGVGADESSPRPARGARRKIWRRSIPTTRC